MSSSFLRARIDFRQRHLPGVSLLAAMYLVGTPAAQAMPSDLAQAYINSALADVKAGMPEKARRRFRWLVLHDRDSADRTARYLHALTLLDEDQPLHFGVRAALAPSTNLKRDSSEDRFLIFPLDDPQSGVSLSLGASVSASDTYRDGRRLTGTIDLERTVATADELDATRLGATLRHEWLSAGQVREAALGLTRRVYPDLSDRSKSPDYVERRLSYAASFWRDGGVTFGYTAELADRDYAERDYMAGVTGTISARFSRPLADLGRITVEGAIANADVQNDSYSFQALGLGISFARQERNGLGWDVGLAHDWRDYVDDFAYLQEPRRDRVTKISLGLSHKDVTFSEMVPKLTCTFSDQRSNVALYTFDSLDCSVALGYAF